MTERSGPLRRIRVLDLGTMVAGPFAATLLGDFGAEVIKVEIPGRGDTLRRVGPVTPQGDSYWFAADARNKKSVTLDLRVPKGRELLLRLAELSDVVVENFVPGTLEQWGLGPDDLRAANPRLIILRASGYGQTGPYRARPGYDRVGLAFGGLWGMTGDPAGEPMRPGVAIADFLTGTFGALGVVLALYWRDACGGDAQDIDAALYESVFRVLEYTAPHYSATGVVRERSGNRGPAVPSGGFLAADGVWLAVAVAEDSMYRRLMLAIGQPGLANEPRFARADGRLADREPIELALREWIAARSSGEAIAGLEAAQIPVARSRNIAEIFEDEQYAARGMIVDVDDPAVGHIRMQGVTPRLSATPGEVSSPAPLLGEHNVEVLGGLLGLSSEQIAQLGSDGVI